MPRQLHINITELLKEIQSHIVMNNVVKLKNNVQTLMRKNTALKMPFLRFTVQTCKRIIYNSKILHLSKPTLT